MTPTVIGYDKLTAEFWTFQMSGMWHLWITLTNSILNNEYTAIFNDTIFTQKKASLKLAFYVANIFIINYFYY